MMLKSRYLYCDQLEQFDSVQIIIRKQKEAMIYEHYMRFRTENKMIV